MTRNRLQSWQQFDPNRKNNNAPNLVKPTPKKETPKTAKPSEKPKPAPSVVVEPEPIAPLIDKLLDEVEEVPKKTKKTKE